MCEATRVLPCLISHPRLLLPLLLHGAQVAMAVAVPRMEEFFMSFDFVQFKKDRQLKPWRYVRIDCMRPCCLMLVGNEHLRPKEHSAFPFTVMCFRSKLVIVDCAVQSAPWNASPPALTDSLNGLSRCRLRWPSSAARADCLLPPSTHGLRYHCSSSLQRLASATDEQRYRCLSENHTTTAVHGTSWPAVRQSTCPAA